MALYPDYNRKLLIDAVRRKSGHIVFLEDGTPVSTLWLFHKIKNPSLYGYNKNPLIAQLDELDKYDLARAFGMRISEFTAWRKSRKTFPQPSRLQSKNASKERGLNTSIRITDFWDVDEVLEWVEDNLESPAKSLARQG
jgi:hypothetical protein